MMLRASSHDLGDKLNLRAVVENTDTDSGVAHSRALVDFVDATLTGQPELTAARAAVVDALGADGVVDAAAVIGNFQRMTRIADATGIPLDDGTEALTADIQALLELNNMPSARQS